MLVQCLNACMRITIPTTMTWWGQGGKPPRSPLSVSWISLGESSSVNIVLILSIFVPLISICAGLVSDFTKNKYGMPRSYCLTLVAVLFFISQVVTGSINDIAHLWIASALLGLAYGSAFSLFPAVCIEWFGMRKCGFLPSFQILNAILSAHFSENWGYLSLSPVVAGNLFSVIFGRNLDAYSAPSHEALLNSPPIDVYSAPQCLLGLNCYLDTIYLTMLATFLAILLSIWAGYRDRLKISMSRKTKLASRSEVI